MTLRSGAAGAGILVAALLLGACAAPAAGTPSPTAGSGVNVPSLDTSGDPALARTIPHTVSGMTLQVFSMRGDVFAAGGASDPSFQAFLRSVGASLSDVSVAIGTGSSASATITIAAFKVKGARSQALHDEFVGAIQAGGQVGSWSQATVGGKQVSTAPNLGEAGGSIYLYVRDDTLYEVIASSQDVAEATLGQLP